MIEEARQLYELAPTEFVAARSALVKRLRADGRRDDAIIVRALRRPLVAEHAINRIAHENPALVRGWADAVVAADRAQSSAIGGGGAGDLRAAAADLRAATAGLIDAAVEPSKAPAADARRNDVIGLLRELTTPAGAVIVVAGLVGAVEPADAGLFAGAPDPPARLRRSTGASTADPTHAPEPSRPDPPSSDLDDARDHAVDLGVGAKRSTGPKQRQADRAARRAIERRLAVAQRTAVDAAASTAAARRRLDVARERLGDALERAAQAQARLDEATATTDSATASATTAEAAVVEIERELRDRFAND